MHCAHLCQVHSCTVHTCAVSQYTFTLCTPCTVHTLHRAHLCQICACAVHTSTHLHVQGAAEAAAEGTRAPTPEESAVFLGTLKSQGVLCLTAHRTWVLMADLKCRVSGHPLMTRDPPGKRPGTPSQGGSVWPPSRGAGPTSPRLPWNTPCVPRARPRPGGLDPSSCPGRPGHAPEGRKDHADAPTPRSGALANGEVQGPRFTEVRGRSAP